MQKKPVHLKKKLILALLKEKEVLLREQKDIDDQFSLKKEDVLSELRSTLAKQKLAKSHSKIGQKGDTLSAKQLDESDETALELTGAHEYRKEHTVVDAFTQINVREWRKFAFRCLLVNWANFFVPDCTPRAIIVAYH